MLYQHTITAYAVPGLKNRHELQKNITGIPKTIQLAADYLKVTTEDLLKQNRKREIVLPRQMIMHYLYTKSINPRIIGDAFNKDRTTVIHAAQTIQDLMDTDETIQNNYQNLKEHLRLNS